MEIRIAREADRERILAISAQVWDGYDYVPRVLDAWLSGEDGELLVALLDGSVAAFSYRTWLAERHAWLQGIRTDTARRGRGAGRALTEASLERSWRDGAQRIGLSTYRDNAESMHIVEAYGFRRVASFVYLEGDLPEGAGLSSGTIHALPEDAAIRFVADSDYLERAGGRFARDVVTAANARYASGTAPQSDVLRAEIEVARWEAVARSLVSEVRGAEAMLNASLARDVDSAVPRFAPLAFAEPPSVRSVVDTAVTSRPELDAGRAAIARADAEVQVMRDMFRPMMTVRTGPAYTMTEGRGWMAMVGVSLPIWRSKLEAGVAEAEGMRAMAAADLRAMTRMIEGDAAVAVNRLQAALDRGDALVRDVLPRARMAIEPAVAGYASGQLPKAMPITSSGPIVGMAWSITTG